MRANNRCRHRHSWLIAGGYWEWCYECGAIREMRRVAENAVAAETYWQRPVGKDGRNPALDDSPKKLTMEDAGK